MIRVAIVEDDRGTRESLVKLLRHASNIDCLGAFQSTEEAERMVPQLLPDVVLMDINLGGDCGIGCVDRLKRDHPQLQFLMLTTYDDSELIFKSLRAGASGYLLKRSAGTELLGAIEEGHRGGAPMSMQIARKVVSHFHQRESDQAGKSLTAGEEEILALLVKGLTSDRIAERLAMPKSGVRRHLHAIYGKLHVQSRLEAVTKCLQRPSANDSAEMPGASKWRGAGEGGPNGLYPDQRRR